VWRVREWRREREWGSECQRNNRSASAVSPTVSLISVPSPLHKTVIENLHCFIGIRSTYHHRSITVNPLSQYHNYWPYKGLLQSWPQEVVQYVVSDIPEWITFCALLRLVELSGLGPFGVLSFFHWLLGAILFVGSIRSFSFSFLTHSLTHSSWPPPLSQQ
jgi:hypothetical protein